MFTLVVLHKYVLMLIVAQLIDFDPKITQSEILLHLAWLDYGVSILTMIIIRYKAYPNVQMRVENFNCASIIRFVIGGSRCLYEMVSSSISKMSAGYAFWIDICSFFGVSRVSYIIVWKIYLQLEMILSYSEQNHWSTNMYSAPKYRRSFRRKFRA